MRRVVVSLVLAGLGGWFGYALLDGRAEGMAPISPVLSFVVILGGGAVAALPYVLAEPRLRTMASKWGEFWSIPDTVAWVVLLLSVAMSLAFAWDFVVLALAGRFGT